VAVRDRGATSSRQTAKPGVHVKATLTVEPIGWTLLLDHPDSASGSPKVISMSAISLLPSMPNSSSALS
jgi:hypothetical protein